jgi:hypothetical protein
MPVPGHRLRRSIAVLAAFLAFGVAAHGALQAIEHHDAAEKAIALCAAAVVLIGAMRLLGPGGSDEPRMPLAWERVATPVSAEKVSSGHTSAAWLQRFLN